MKVEDIRSTVMVGVTSRVWMFRSCLVRWRLELKNSSYFMPAKFDDPSSNYLNTKLGLKSLVSMKAGGWIDSAQVTYFRSLHIKTQLFLYSRIRRAALFHLVPSSSTF